MNRIFIPFGGELQFANSGTNHYKYGGHEQDIESGLYNYGARHYSPSLSRFLTPDWSSNPVPVPYADLLDPQSLNLYGYTRNNPITKGDPDGHCWLPQAACDFVRGALNAWGSDNAAGVGRDNHGSTAYQMGQVVGDGAAVVQGTFETGAGAGGEVAGVGLDAAHGSRCCCRCCPRS